jgi:hypothetical protein
MQLCAALDLRFICMKATSVLLFRSVMGYRSYAHALIQESPSIHAFRARPDKEEIGEVQYLADDLPGCWPDERSLVSSSTCPLLEA